MKPFSVYKKDICCDHFWIYQSTNLDKTKQYICDDCGATCIHDEKGIIINYSLNHKHKVSPGDAFSYDLKVDPKRYLHRRDY